MIKGLTGDQGVIIPANNVQNLMLDSGVVQAVREGQFHIYAIRTVEEAIELLLGRPAGRPDRKGNYPKGTVFAAIAKRLAGLREHARQEQEALLGAAKETLIH